MWHMFVIPALGRPRQEAPYMVKPRMDYVARLCLNKQTK